ncbi:DEAD/DEAH box helicase [Vibrio ostreicida]|uniref:DEAD/DEAH box helicase n=1 Tax=Vibrio ostreicida TaxID=526588 RepID=UPI000970C94F|nr:DEAD/DEAH box helicase [Vibrio ostreicida]
MPFSSLSLSAALINALPNDIQNPTEIQSLAIPVMLAKKDLLGLANTGSGKTLAYSLPMLEHMHASTTPLKGLILVPTRELATQVTDAINQVSQSLNLHAASICGGVEKHQQQEILAQNPHILVATTGRLLDLVNDGALDLKSVDYLILDEADRLLNMGFWPDVQRITKLTSGQRHTAMFSATFSDELKHKATQLMNSPTQVAAHQENSTSQHVQEQLYLVNKGSKTKALIALIDQHQWPQVLVFIGAKENADGLTKKLNKAGISSSALHGNKPQAERQKTLERFKQGETKVLIATDLLARGIHIEQLPLVINFELPSHAEVYIHRVGRTARAGQSGSAISLVCHSEVETLSAIRELTQRALPLQELDDFPVTDKPSSGESKRAPRDKKANRRTNNKNSIKQFQGKVKHTRSQSG